MMQALITPPRAVHAVRASRNQGGVIRHWCEGKAMRARTAVDELGNEAGTPGTKQSNAQDRACWLPAGQGLEPRDAETRE